MITKESLEEKYIKLSTVDLLEIVASDGDYTELAVEVAKRELQNRNVSNEEIKIYEPVLGAETRELEERNGLVDLKLWQKVIFYFLWIPRFRKYFTEGFMSEGYILKSNQSTYYSIVGFGFFLFSTATMYFFQSFFLIWLLGFLPTYLFDTGYNKNRLTEKINQILAHKNRQFGYY